MGPTSREGFRSSSAKRRARALTDSKSSAESACAAAAADKLLASEDLDLDFDDFLLSSCFFLLDFVCVFVE